MADLDNFLANLPMVSGGAPTGDPFTSAALVPPDASALGMGDFNNIMQQLGAPPAPDMSAASPQAAPAPEPQSAASATPQPKRSILSMLGQLADGIATVGGAAPQFQPSIDARDARDQAALTDPLKLKLLQQQVATGNSGLQDHAIGVTNGILARAAALKAAGGDPIRALQFFGQQAGLAPADITSLGQSITDNPHLLDAFGEKKNDPEYFGQIVVGRDPSTGNLMAYQLSKDGSSKAALPDGVEYADPTKMVNTGGSNVAVGTHGTPGQILPNTVAPNTAATNAKDITVARMNNAARQHLQDTKPAAAGKPGSGDPFATYQEARTGLTDLVKQIDTITNDSALPSATGLTGAVASHIPGSGAARVHANIERAKAQSLVGAINGLKALGNGNLGFRMTQGEATAFGNTLGGTLGATNQSAADYVKNLKAARAQALEKISRMDADAQRLGILKPKPTLAAPPVAQARMNNGGWGKVMVQ